MGQILKQCFIVMAVIACIGRISPAENLEWEYNYECFTLPNEPWDEKSPRFTLCNKTGDAQYGIDDKILKISGTTGLVSWGLPVDAEEWNHNADGVTVEWKLKTEPQTKRWSQSINVSLGGNIWHVYFAGDKVAFYSTGNLILKKNCFLIDTTDFHVYRLSIDKSSNIARLYVDSNTEPAMEFSGKTVTGKTRGILFGMTSIDTDGAGYWEYIRWTAKEGFPQGKLMPAEESTIE